MISRVNIESIWLICDSAQTCAVIKLMATKSFHTEDFNGAINILHVLIPQIKFAMITICMA